MQFKSLQSIFAIWQARLFFLLQKWFGVTFFVKFQEDSGVSQKELIDSYEDILYYIMNIDVCRMNAYTDAATNRTLCGGKTFVDIDP